MPDDNSSSTSPTAPRPKPARSATSGTVRGRTSPTPGASGEQNGDGRPPTKRARKAINCEPCRNSKLKCDRFVDHPFNTLNFYRTTIQPEIDHVRPVSCEVCIQEITFVEQPPDDRNISGTSAMCYQDARGHEGSDPLGRGDDQQ